MPISTEFRMRLMQMLTAMATMIAALMLLSVIGASPVAAQAQPASCSISRSGLAVTTTWTAVPGAQRYQVWINGEVDHEVIGTTNVDNYQPGASGVRHYSISATVGGTQTPRTYCGRIDFTPRTSCSVTLNGLQNSARIVVNGPALGQFDTWQLWRNGRPVLSDDATVLAYRVSDGNNFFSVAYQTRNSQGQVIATSPRTYCGNARVDGSAPRPAACQVTSLNGGLRVTWQGGNADAIRIYRLGKPFFRTDNDGAFFDSSARAGVRYHYSVVGLRDVNGGPPIYEEQGGKVYCGSQTGQRTGLPAPAVCDYELAFRGATVRIATLDLPGTTYQFFRQGQLVFSQYLAETPGEFSIGASQGQQGQWSVRAVRPGQNPSPTINCA